MTRGKLYHFIATRQRGGQAHTPRVRPGTGRAGGADGSYVGTYQGGVTRLDASGARPIPGTVALWLNPHGLERIGERLYAASMGGGLVAFEPGKGARNASPKKLGPLPSSDVTALETFAGALWVGTRAGLARLPR